MQAPVNEPLPGVVTLMDGVTLERAPAHLHVELSPARTVLSSAVLNGGLTTASHLLNLTVPQHCETAELPDATLGRYCVERGWRGTCVGMMTAATMDSLRIVRTTEQGVDLVVLVTCGLSNPRCAGDRAEHRRLADRPTERGTINTIVLTSAILTEAALVESLVIATEGKSTALQQAGVTSPVSGRPATGTGTDAIAVVGGCGPQKVSWAGKHVLFGEIVGRSVLEAVTAAIDPADAAVDAGMDISAGLWADSQ
jgi:adenosylcobinamide amidohydrolase